MKVLELLLSDPDYYDSADDPETEVLGPWRDWINRIATEFPNGGPAAFGEGGAPWASRFTLWDLRWSGDGHCEVMVMDTEEGDEFWWVPPEPAPAELMRHARFVDSAGEAS